MTDDFLRVTEECDADCERFGDGSGRENAIRERIWFSPACLSAGPLFQIR